MSAIQHGPSCEPSEVGEFVFGFLRMPEPTHDRCPGGEGRPGLIGGWICPCACHHAAGRVNNVLTQNSQPLVTSLWPGGDCEPCEDGRHHKCVGWRPPGFCGCTRGLCALRLMTGVMWDVTEHDDQGEP